MDPHTYHHTLQSYVSVLSYWTVGQSHRISCTTTHFNPTYPSYPAVLRRTVGQSHRSHVYHHTLQSNVSILSYCPIGLSHGISCTTTHFNPTCLSYPVLRTAPQNPTYYQTLLSYDPTILCRTVPWNPMYHHTLRSYVSILSYCPT